MRGLIITVVVLFAIGFVAVKAGRVFTNHHQFKQDVASRLDMVDESTFDLVRETLVHDAKKLNFEVSPSDIHIEYEPTRDQSFMQGFVSGIAEFENRRVGIAVDYTARLFGIPIRQEVSASKIKQIRARQRIRPDVEQLLKEP